MALDIFKGMRKKPDEQEEYLELNLEEGTKKPGKLTIVIENLNSYADSDRIQRRVREGAVVLIKIRDLKDKDVEELKRSISRVKKTCDAIGGDIAGISDDWVLVTPCSATIERQQMGSEEEIE
jgi:SepF-like predicted cell division protein (DUF552 family)